MPKATDVLNTLKDANEYVTIAATVAGTVVPLGKWLVSEFKTIGVKGETISYPVLVQNDTAELTAIGQLAADDLAAINAELAKLGKPPIVAPADPPSAT